MDVRDLPVSKSSVGASSLLHMARRVCIRNVKMIDDVGDLPYQKIRGIVEKVRCAQQLRQLELNSPQLVGEDGDVWLNIIKQDIPGWEKKSHRPRNPCLWHKVYQKLQEENKSELDAASDKLKAAMDSYKTEKASKQSQLVDMRTLPFLRYATRVGKIRVKAPRQSGRIGETQSSNSHLTFNGGSKTKNVMQRVRREAREMSLLSRQNSKLSQPTHLLGRTQTRIQQAPRSLIEGHRRPPAPISIEDRSCQMLRKLEPEGRNRPEKPASGGSADTSPQMVKRKMMYDDMAAEAGKPVSKQPRPGTRQTANPEANASSATVPENNFAQAPTYRAPRLKIARTSFPAAQINAHKAPKSSKEQISSPQLGTQPSPSSKFSPEKTEEKKKEQKPMILPTKGVEIFLRPKARVKKPLIKR